MGGPSEFDLVLTLDFTSTLPEVPLGSDTKLGPKVCRALSKAAKLSFVRETISLRLLSHSKAAIKKLQNNAQIQNNYHTISITVISITSSRKFHKNLK